MRSFSLFLLIIIGYAVYIPADAGAQSALPPQLAKLLYTQDSLLISDLDGKKILAHNPTMPRVPASIFKLFTSALALETLGPRFRFETRALLQGSRLLVIGSGDPSLVSEELTKFAAQIATAAKQRGVRTFSVISFDDTAFSPVQIPGVSGSDNPYDVLNGALVGNFNTTFVERTSNGFQTAEAQTPLTPLAVEKAGALLKKRKDRINVASNEREVLRNFGELLAAFLRLNGLACEQLSYEAPRDAAKFEEIALHRSGKDLREIIRDLLRHSNNFTANQLYLYIGGKEFGWPATLEKGSLAMHRFLTRKGYPEVISVEGSGISRDNRLTCEAMVRLLISPEFLPYRSLLKDDIKSGTLSSAASYAGYLGANRAFCLILNDRRTPTLPRREAALKQLRLLFPAQGTNAK